MRYIVTLICSAAALCAVASGGELQPGVFEGNRLIEEAEAELPVQAAGMRLAVQEGNLVLDNSNVRLVVRRRTSGFRREFYACDAAGNWRLVLRDALLGEVVPTARPSGGAMAPIAFQRVEIVRNDERGVELRLRAAAARAELASTITLRPGESFFRMLLEAGLQGRWVLEQFQTNLAFAPEPNGEPNGRNNRNGDFIWTPGYRAQPDDVAGDEAFSTPAAIVQRGSLLAAILPDTAEIRTMGMQSAVAVERAGNVVWLSWGIRKYDTRGGGFHHHTETMVYDLKDATLRCGYRVLLDAQAEPMRGFRRVIDDTGPLPRPAPGERVAIQRHTGDTWREIVWHETERRLRDAAALEFTAERQDLRAAYGLALHARRTGNDEQLKLARSVAQSLLAAPAERGVFPLIGVRNNGRLEWQVQEFAGQQAYSTRDMSHAARWLLKWREFLPREEAAILQRCRAYADVLVRMQLPSGCIPAFLKAEDLAPVREVLYDTGAESAESALFLAELHAATGEERYLLSAMTVLQYIRTSVMPQGRWMDRTTLSMPAPGPGGQYPQSMAAIISAAGASLAVYGQSGRAEYLETGLQIADYLALYQNRWYAEWLRGPYGAIVSRNYGGKFDAALQADAAELFMKAYRAGGGQTCARRALAALRAGFALIEPADDAVDSVEPVGSDSAGNSDETDVVPETGELIEADELALETDDFGEVAELPGRVDEALATFEIIREGYGDAFIDASGLNPHDSRLPAGGIDACLIRDINISADTIRFELASPFAWERPALVRIFTDEHPREVIADGASLGIFTQSQLAEGIHVAVRGLLDEPNEEAEDSTAVEVEEGEEKNGEKNGDEREDENEEDGEGNGVED